MKYIVFEIRTPGSGFTQRLPVVFPNQLVHSDVAEAIAPMLGRKDSDIKPVSAGHCYTKVQVTSEGSDSLNLKPDPTDENLINMYDYFPGIE